MAEKQNVPSWLERALDPTTPTTENNETVRTANNYFDDIGAEIIYPTIRMGEDGKLYTPEDPMEEAIKNNDYIVVEGPPNRETAEKAMQISKQISNQISAARTKKDATDKGIMAAEERMTSDTVSFDKGGMPQRDDGFLAPLDIKDKAEAYVKELRIAEDTNYDEADNKYDAIRHIGASLALYAQYPDLASDVILGAKEYVGSIGDPRGKKMDLHNNSIGKELYKMLDEEQADNLTTEQALEIAKSYVEEWDLAEKEGRKLDLPEEMKPLMYYGATKEPESEDGGLYEIGPEGTWVEKAQMDRGGIMSRNDAYDPIFDVPMRDDFPSKKAKEMDIQLEDLFLDYYNAVDDVSTISKQTGKSKDEIRKGIRSGYSDKIKKIYEKDPDTFKEAIQGPNTDARIAALNELAFGSNPDLPYDEEIGDAAPTKLNIPFGSEGDTFLGGRTGLSGTVITGIDEINVAGGEEDRDNVVRHEYVHLANKGEGAKNIFNDIGVSDEILVRSFDYVRGLVGGDEKLKKEASDFFEDRTSLSPYKAVQIVVEALPQLYEKGVFNQDEATLDVVQDVVKRIDEDEQGFVSSIFSDTPDAVDKPIAEFPRTWKLAKNEDTEKIKELLSVIPFSKNVEKDTYDQRYEIDREAAGLSEGGLMADPLMLSETAEEEAEPKMGVGDYIEGTKELITDFSPAGTAEAIIETGKALTEGDYGKAAISALGAIPGGKTAGKAVNALEVGVDATKLSGDELRNYASATVKMLEDTAKKTGKVAGDKGEKLYAPVEEGTKVAVRKNLNSSVGEGIDQRLNTLQTLHAGTYNGKAISYQPVVTVKNAEFTIGQAGRRDIASKSLQLENKSSKSKFPMAAVNGEYTNSPSLLEQYTPTDLVEVGFNPKANHLFIDMQTGQAVRGAEEATIIGDRVYARGVKYWKKSEAPEPLPTSAGEEIPSDVRFREMNAGGLMSDEYNRAES